MCFDELFLLSNLSILKCKQMVSVTLLRNDTVLRKFVCPEAVLGILDSSWKMQRDLIPRDFHNTLRRYIYYKL